MGASDLSHCFYEEKGSFASAAEAVITKIEAAIRVYEESIDNMFVDYHEIELIIPRNKKAIEKLNDMWKEAKHVYDRTTEEARQSAQREMNKIEAAIDKAEDITRDLERFRDRLWQRIDSYRGIISTLQGNINTLRRNVREMNQAADNASNLSNQIADLASTAHDYGNEVLERLNTDGVSSGFSDTRVQFSDHSVLLNISDTLDSCAEKFAEKEEELADASDTISTSMRDRISVAAVAKAREIEEDARGGAKAIKKMAIETYEAYDYLCSYTSLARKL